MFSTRYDRSRAYRTLSYKFVDGLEGDNRGDMGGEEGAVVLSPDPLRGLNLYYFLGVDAYSSFLPYSSASSLLACLAKY